MEPSTSWFKTLCWGLTRVSAVNDTGGMRAAVLQGHGDIDKLQVREDMPIPQPGSSEVLIRVGASAVNNTDINTRVGWYSQSDQGGDTSWSGSPMKFPRIQGADCCGEITRVGSNVDPGRIGERVLVRTMQEPAILNGKLTPITLGSEINGAFAQYVSVRSSEAFTINSSLDDAELASFPCSYSTAEGLLQRAQVGGERVLITGASGGVGSAAVQLAAMRGATVFAVTTRTHADQVKQIGAAEIVNRDGDLLDQLGESRVDVVIDLVGGPNFASLLGILRPGGRYATAGAVAGAHVALDLRDLYLKDLTFYGCTFHPKSVFTDLISYVEQERIQPLVAARYDLSDIHAAQERFIEKDFIGKIAIVT